MDYEKKESNGKVVFVVHKKNKSSENKTVLSDIKKVNRDLLNKNIFHKLKGPGAIISDDGNKITITFSDSSVLTYIYPSEDFFDNCAFTRINTVKLTGTTSVLKPKKNINDDNELSEFQLFLKKENIDSEVKEMSIKEDFYNTSIWGFKVGNSDYIPVQDWMDFFIKISKYLYKRNKSVFLDIVINQRPMKNNKTPYYSKGSPSRKWFGSNCYLIIQSSQIFIEQHITAREVVGLLRYCQDDFDYDNDEIKIYIGPRFKKRPNESISENKKETILEDKNSRPVYKLHSGFQDFVVNESIHKGKPIMFNEDSSIPLKERLSSIDKLDAKLWRAYKDDIVDPTISKLWFSKGKEEFNFTCDFMTFAKKKENEIFKKKLCDYYPLCYFEHIKVNFLQKANVSNIFIAYGISLEGKLDFLGAWENISKVNNDQSIIINNINELLTDAFYDVKKRGIKNIDLLIINSNHDKKEIKDCVKKWNISDFIISGEYNKYLENKSDYEKKKYLEDNVLSTFKETIKLFSLEKNYEIFNNFILTMKKLDDCFLHMFDGCLSSTLCFLIDIYKSKISMDTTELLYIVDNISKTCSKYKDNKNNDMFSEFDNILNFFMKDISVYGIQENFKRDIYSKIEVNYLSKNKVFTYDVYKSKLNKYVFSENDTNCLIISKNNDGDIHVEVINGNKNISITIKSENRNSISYKIYLNNRYDSIFEEYIKNINIIAYRNVIYLL